MSQPWRQLRIVLLASTAVLVTVGTLYSINQSSSRSAVTATGTSSFTSDGLMVSSRDGLSVCVDSVTGIQLDSAEAMSAVQSAILQLQSNPLWDRAGYAKREPKVVFGCPYQPIVMDPAVRRVGSTIQNVPRRQVVTPSEFRLLVFVMSNSEIQRIFGNLQVRFRIQSEETYCVEQQALGASSCEAVTLGSYFSPEEFANIDALRTALAQNLGLTSALPSTRPEPPPGLVYLRKERQLLVPHPGDLQPYCSRQSHRRRLRL